MQFMHDDLLPLSSFPEVVKLPRPKRDAVPGGETRATSNRSKLRDVVDVDGNVVESTKIFAGQIMLSRE